jgi:hypothetical protein
VFGIEAKADGLRGAVAGKESVVRHPSGWDHFGPK